MLHFLFLAAFSWMMVEGLALYLCCTKGVFNRRDMRVKYFLLGWGLPVIVVVISLAARFPDYGNGPQYRFACHIYSLPLKSASKEQHWSIVDRGFL